MRKGVIGALALGLALAAGPAWALTDADTGQAWQAAPTRQKLQVANILSRDLGGDPQAYVKCLDEMFAKSENQSLSIRDAAQQCRGK